MYNFRGEGPNSIALPVSVCVTVVFGALGTLEKQEGLRLELLQQVTTQAAWCNRSLREALVCLGTGQHLVFQGCSEQHVLLLLLKALSLVPVVLALLKGCDPLLRLYIATEGGEASSQL